VTRFRFARESKFARWCGTGAVALSSGEAMGTPVGHRLDFGGNRINSVLYIASVTQHRQRRRSPQLHRPQDLRRQETRREARRAHKRHLANRVIRRMWSDEKEHRDTRRRPAP
jgi:transposase